MPNKYTIVYPSKEHWPQIHKNGVYVAHSQCEKHIAESLVQELNESINSYNQAIDDCIKKLSSTTEVNRLLNELKRS